MTYEEKCSSDNPKNKPNRTQFSSLAPNHSSLNAERYTLNAVILQNEPNHLFAKDLRKTTLVNSVDLAYNSAQFESANAAFALFREQFETIRDNWRYFETRCSTANLRPLRWNYLLEPFRSLLRNVRKRQKAKSARMPSQLASINIQPARVIIVPSLFGARQARRETPERQRSRAA
jgi:hypothetical protein